MAMKLVSDIMGGTQTEGVWEQDAEKNIWTAVTGVWRKLNNEELHDLYYSPSIIRTLKSRIKLARQVARMGRTGTCICCR
jgi:hypothetical protein